MTGKGRDEIMKDFSRGKEKGNENSMDFREEKKKKAQRFNGEEFLVRGFCTGALRA